MGEQRLDCNWCGSARSIEHGICQICLMEYPLETRVIQLPVERHEKKRVAISNTTVVLDDAEVVAE